MATPAFDLQPMSIGDILDRTVRLYRAFFLPTLGIAAVPYFLIVPAGAAVGSAAFVVRDWQRVLTNPGVIAGIVLGGVAFAVVFVWLNFVSMGALARYVSERYLGGTPTIWTSYQSVLRRGHSLVCAYFLAGALISGVLIFGVIVPLVGAALLIQTSILLFLLLGLVAIVGGIAIARLMLRFLLVTQVIVIEDLRGRAALKRTWNLMRGTELRASAILIFATVVGYIIALVLRFPTLILSAVSPGVAMSILDAIMGGLAQIVVIPFGSIGFTLLYYDSRIRKEAFDLEMMARDLGATPPAGPGTAPGGAGGPRMTPRAPAPSWEATDPGAGPVAPPWDVPPAAFPPAAAPPAPGPSPPGAAAPPARPRPAAPFKICPKCQAQVAPVRPTCPSCGTPVPFRSPG